MARVLKPPAPIDLPAHQPSLFLAGSIEMGRAEAWQAQVESDFEIDDLTLLNPRRDEWDSSWEQSIDNPQFREQVEWELEAQERASLIVMYFAPTTQSPITLLELGLFARSNKLLVCCPQGFWRRGNVEVVCARYHIPRCETLDQLVQTARSRLVGAEPTAERG